MMKDYTISCTEEQTKKALELGAPIEYAKVIDTINENSIRIPEETGEFYLIPTAEEIIGWLEEQKVFVHIIPCFDVDCGWNVASKGYSKYGYISNINVCKTRKEATIAAIDFALDYLAKEKQ